MKYLLFLIALFITVSTRADEPVAGPIDDLIHVMDVVSEHHFSPPTRQELVVAALKDIEKLKTTGQISEEVSAIGGRDNLNAYLRTRLEGKETEVRQCLSDPGLHLWLDHVVMGGMVFERTKDLAVNEQLAANRYVGIGVQATMNDGKFIFMNVMEGGTAAAAGILPQDTLLEVDGQKVDGQSMTEIIDQLRGPEQSKLQVVVQSSSDAPRTLQLVRRVVPIKTVQKVDNSNPNMAVFKVERLTSSTVSELEDLIDELPGDIAYVSLMLPLSADLHLNHLLFDALAEESYLATAISRTGTAEIRSQPGTIVGKRKVIISHVEGSTISSLTERFAISAGIEVVDPNYLRDDEFRNLPLGFSYTSYPIGNGEYSVQVATKEIVPAIEDFPAQRFR